MTTGAERLKRVGGRQGMDDPRERVMWDIDNLSRSRYTPANATTPSRLKLARPGNRDGRFA